MTFNAKKIAEKIPLWVAYDIHGRKEETYSLIELCCVDAGRHRTHNRFEVCKTRSRGEG